MAIKPWAVLFAAVVALLGGPAADATEGPTTPQGGIDACCAPLFGKWRGKGWITEADGRRVDIDAEIEVILSDSGESALFLTSYTPLDPSEGKTVRKVALLNYLVDGWWDVVSDPNLPEEFRFTPYRFRYLEGGPFWGAKFQFSPFHPRQWMEPHPSGGIVRYFSLTDEVAWTLAGYCCAGGEQDRLVSYVLVTRVGPLGKPARFWGWDP